MQTLSIFSTSNEKVISSEPFEIPFLNLTASMEKDAKATLCITLLNYYANQFLKFLHKIISTPTMCNVSRIFSQFLSHFAKLSAFLKLRIAGKELGASYEELLQWAAASF